MAITQDHIQILKSERLTDTPDGGGRITGNPVADGVPNDVFPNIGDIDRATGRIRLRKLYGGVKSPNTDLAVNGNVMVARPPSQPGLHTTLFATNDWSDERAAAASRLESYLAAGPITSLVVLGTQIAGQQAVICYAHETLPLPEVGDTLVVSEENLATGAITAQQFVRVTGVEAELATFTDSRGDFQRLIVTLELSGPLNREYPGDVQVQRNNVGQASPTLIRTTRVAAAQKYVGITPLAEVPAVGSFQVSGESMFTQLVPATTAEKPLVDQLIAQARGAALAIGEEVVETQEAVQVDGGSTQTVFARRAVLPGTLTVEIEGATSNDDWEGSDDAVGQVVRSGGGQNSVDAVVSVDYAGAAVSFVGIAVGATIARVTLRYVPAVVATQLPEFDLIEVGDQNRGTSYVHTLPTQPAPGTLRVAYRALGRWYELRDQGDGSLEGDAGAGGATFNFATRSLLLSLGIQPDVGSIIVISWGQTEELLRLESGLTAPAIEIDAGEAFKPGTVVATWDVGGTTFTATDSNGQWTGDASGPIDYGAGTAQLYPNALPPAGTAYVLDYEVPQGAQPGGPANGTSINGGSASFTIGDTPLEPGSVRFSIELLYQVTLSAAGQSVQRSKTLTATVTDTGNGFLRIDGVSGNGTVNYADGAVSVNITGTEVFNDTLYTPLLGGLRMYRVTGQASGEIQSIDGLTYRQEDPATVAGQTSNPGTEMVVRIAQNASYAAEPGTALFAFGDDVYFDRDGQLYRAHDAGTNAGTQAGSADYAGGTFAVTSWVPGAAPGFAALALAVRLEQRQVGIVAGRVAAQRLRPASFQLVATRVDGTQIIADSQPDGSLSSPGGTATGSVDFEMAWFEARFYEDDGVTPAFIVGATARYNAVAQSSLPIDPQILGLDPVRLPLDGRVPMFSPGGLAVVHHTDDDTLPGGFGPNDVHTLPFARLTWVRLRDQAGAHVDTAHYVLDLDAGTITATAEADFSAYQAPLVARFRIEDMAVVSDAELSGRLTLTKAITHDFPLANTYISGLIVFGDLQARVYGVFDQETWTGEFSDEPIGDPVGDASYNDSAWPITTTNAGAVKDRWALVFTNANQFNIIGEISGQVGTGNITTDTAPINPATGVPFFVIPWQGWGSGWSQGNVVQFPTDGADAPFWAALTVMPSEPAPGDIDFQYEFRVNAD